MSRRRLALASCCAVLVALASAPRALAQSPLIMQSEMTKSFTLDLHSVADDVLVYPGDAQYVYQIEIRPMHSGRPRVEYQNAAQVATLRIRDLSLFEPEAVPQDTSQDLGDEVGDEQPSETSPPVSQGWVIKLWPNSPASFVLHCEGGKGDFDLTDMQVREVYLHGDSTQLRLSFARPNPIALERLKVTAQWGKLELRHLLNARLKLATLQIARAQCDVDLTGKLAPGLSEIFFEGEPRSLRVTLPHAAGVHVEGIAAAVAAFDRKNMERVGQALQTKGFDAQACRIKLYFARAVPKLEVQWED